MLVEADEMMVLEDSTVDSYSWRPKMKRVHVGTHTILI